MDIRNHEGYIDEVPWQAIRNVVVVKRFCNTSVQ